MTRYHWFSCVWRPCQKLTPGMSLKHTPSCICRIKCLLTWWTRRYPCRGCSTDGRAGWMRWLIGCFVVGEETRVGNWPISYKADVECVAVTVDAPRIVIITTFGYDGIPWIIFVVYLHVVVWAAVTTALKMEMLEVQINIVAVHYSNYPGTVQVVWIVIWVVWTGEVSLQVG